VRKRIIRYLNDLAFNRNSADINLIDSTMEFGFMIKLNDKSDKMETFINVDSIAKLDFKYEIKGDELWLLDQISDNVFGLGSAALIKPYYLVENKIYRTVVSSKTNFDKNVCIIEVNAKGAEDCSHLFMNKSISKDGNVEYKPLKNLEGLDITNFDVKDVRDISYMFCGLDNIENEFTVMFLQDLFYGIENAEGVFSNTTGENFMINMPALGEKGQLILENLLANSKYKMVGINGVLLQGILPKLFKGAEVDIIRFSISDIKLFNLLNNKKDVKGIGMRFRFEDRDILVELKRVGQFTLEMDAGHEHVVKALGLKNNSKILVDVG
jgi:hypothetical protein